MKDFLLLCSHYSCFLLREVSSLFDAWILFLCKLQFFDQCNVTFNLSQTFVLNIHWELNVNYISGKSSTPGTWPSATLSTATPWQASKELPGRNHQESGPLDEYNDFHICAGWVLDSGWFLKRFFFFSAAEMKMLSNPFIDCKSLPLALKTWEKGKKHPTTILH